MPIVLRLLKLVLVVILVASCTNDIRHSGNLPSTDTTLEFFSQGRNIGQNDAKNTGYLFWSPSCTFCADFLGSAYPTVVSTYVKSGALRLVFMDFPRNNADLEMVAALSCLSPQTHELAIQKVAKQRFGDQLQYDKWAVHVKAVFLKEVMGEYLPIDTATSCMLSEDRKSFAKKMKTYSLYTYNFGQTPTLLLNGHLSDVSDLTRFDDAMRSFSVR